MDYILFNKTRKRTHFNLGNPYKWCTFFHPKTHKQARCPFEYVFGLLNKVYNIIHFPDQLGFRRVRREINV